MAKKKTILAGVGAAALTKKLSKKAKSVVTFGLVKKKNKEKETKKEEE